jgi:hypothetical protein
VIANTGHDAAGRNGVRAVAYQKQLVEIAKQLDAGDLRALVKTTVSLNEASAAYSGAVRDNSGYGKCRLEVRSLRSDSGRTLTRFAREPSDCGQDHRQLQLMDLTRLI